MASDPRLTEWTQDREQVARFEERLSGSPVSRRFALGILGAAAAGTLAVACGSDNEGDAPSSGATSGTAAPGGQASGGTGPAAGEKLAANQTYRAVTDNEPATFDYNFNLYGMASNYVSAGLLKFDPNQAAVPDIAERFTVNAAGDVYTFKLRTNSKWSNGDAIKASDFVYSFTRRLDPNSGADYKGFLQDIKNGKKFSDKQAQASDLGLKAIDDTTLEVTLEQPTGYFPVLVAYQAAFPVHPPTAQKFGNKTGTEVDNWVSSGPFSLAKWDHQKSFELAKNPNYWNASNIKIDKITYQIIKLDQMVAAYENNEIDTITQGSFGDLKRLEADAKFKDQILKFDQVGTWYLMPNPLIKPFDNLKVRQAMNHAVDREKIVKEIIPSGMATVAYTQNPPGTPHYNPNKYDELTKYEGKDAVKRLAGTEYEGGRNWPKITISMRNNESDIHKAVMAALVQMFKDNLGMTVDQEQGDPQVVYNDMRQGKKQLMWLRWYLDYPDGNNTNFETFSATIPAGSRRAWWDNADFEKLVAQAKGEPNQEKRKQLYAQSDEIVQREAVGIFAYYPQAYKLRRPTVKGMPKNAAGATIPDWNIFMREVESLYIVEKA